jgi:hypothetical protein
MQQAEVLGLTLVADRTLVMAVLVQIKDQELEVVARE